MELKARRDVRGISQEALAVDAGVNRTFVAKLELGQTAPSLTSLFKLCKALKVEPEKFVASLSKRYKEEQGDVRKRRPSAE